jgi:hypothetical protein
MVTHDIGKVIKVQNPQFPYNTIHLKIVEDDDCKKCFFNIPNSINCNKPTEVGYCSQSMRYDCRGAIFIQVANEANPSISPKCIFCESIRGMKCDFNRSVTMFIPTNLYPSNKTLSIRREYLFKYCPVCGKELK